MAAAFARSSWRWSRSIAREAEPLWTERLAGEVNWMIVERTGRARLRVEVYFPTCRPAEALAKKWGGKAGRFNPRPPAPSPPVRVDGWLEIFHDEKVRATSGRLLIPYGIAFGSGEHATTLMLLRALAREKDLAMRSVLDLGTGSGVLALAARSLGAVQVAASDFDPDAVRTARRNERLNFATRRIRWEVADVLKLRAAPRHDLVLANLFSEVLIEAAPRLVRVLRPGGELWLSGVLRSQQDEVAAAYRSAGLRLVKTTSRGRWIMQRWRKPARA